MPSQPLKQFQQAAENPWLRLAHGGGSGGAPPGGRELSAGGGARKPPSLTQQFNAAAKKPVVVSESIASAARIAELKRLMRETAQSTAVPQASRSASVMQIEALKKKLSQPRLTLDRSPLGTVTNSYDPRRDRQVVQAIQEMQAQLKQQRGKAKHDFNQATGLGM
jgi:hypothetical protein